VVSVQGRSSRSYTGKDQVRAYLQTTALQLRTLTRSTPIVQGGIVTWSERAQFQREAFAFDVSILATVRSSRITSLVYRQGTSTNGPSAAAEPAPMQLPSLTWPAAIALIGLLLLGVVFGRPRRPASHSRLDGRLLLELRRQHRNERHNRAA